MGTEPDNELLIQGHLRTLRLEKGLSQHTAAAYGRDLRQFAGFLATSDTGLLDASGEQIRSFLGAGEWRPSTRARKTAALRSFYKDAVLSSRLKADPTRSLAGVRLESDLPKVLTVSQYLQT